MALILPGAIIAEIRGKLGENVYLRTQGGMTVRTVGTWLQPDTQRQLDARAVITALSQAWSGTLTNDQRAAWRSYAHQHPRNNRWGVPTLTNGYTRFVRTNTYQYRDSQSIAYPNPPDQPPIHPPAWTPIVYELAAIQVTGTLNPDATGTYHLDGLYGPDPLWKRDDDAYYLWRYAALHRYRISDAPGNPTPSWIRLNDRYGTYAPDHGATGTATVTAVDDDAAFQITFPLANYNPPPTGLRIFLFAGAPQTPGTNFFAAPWRYIASLTYNGCWTREPWLDLHPFAPNQGDRCWAYLVAQDTADGALSTPGRADVLAIDKYPSPPP